MFNVLASMKFFKKQFLVSYKMMSLWKRSVQRRHYEKKRRLL